MWRATTGLLESMRAGTYHRLFIATMAATALLAPSLAAASEGDGFYGRWDHDFTLSAGLGGGVAFLGNDETAAVTGDLRLRIADAAGPVIAGRWAPNARDYLFFGVEIRPLFPMLPLIGLATGDEFWDLTLQSLSVDIGAAVLPLAGDTGVGLGVGIALSVPVVLPAWAGRTRGLRWGQGIWIRWAARFVDASSSYQAAPSGGDGDEWMISASLILKMGLGSGTSSWEPARYRLR